MSILLYRAFIAWEVQIAVDPKEEHALMANLEEYKSRLLVRSQVLPDFFILQGWLNKQGRQNWPSLYFSDIAAYLKMKTPAELYTRLINEYKHGEKFQVCDSLFQTAVCLLTRNYIINSLPLGKIFIRFFYYQVFFSFFRRSVWIQIRPDILKVLICVQSVFKRYQQTTLGHEKCYTVF